jgi:hypothetical protein
MRFLGYRLLAGTAWCALVALGAPSAFAQSDADRATARALGGDGQQALDAKDYKTAEDRFRRADSLVHAPTLMLGLARALAGLGRYVEAQETYNRIVREGLPPGASEVFKKALADAKKEVAGVGLKVGGVTITVRGPAGVEVSTAKVVLDGAPVSSASLGVRRSVDPGPHALRVTADGFKPADVTFAVPVGGTVDEPVALDADATAPPAGPPGAAPSSTTPGVTAIPAGARTAAPSTPAGGAARAALPWVAFGLGGVGLTVGAATGFVAMIKHSALSNNCSGTICEPRYRGDIDSYDTVATVSTVGFTVGGVGVAAGTILLLTQPKGEGPAAVQPVATAVRVTPVLGPGVIGAVAEF